MECSIPCCAVIDVRHYTEYLINKLFNTNIVFVLPSHFIVLFVGIFYTI